MGVEYAAILQPGVQNRQIKKALVTAETFLFKTHGRSSSLYSLLRAYLDDRDGRLLVLASGYRPLSAPQRIHVY
jgi:hypothetical protein